MVKWSNRSRVIHNEESEATATHHKELWLGDDLNYLHEQAGKLTVMELAIDLGRTYIAIQLKGAKEGLSLDVPGKAPMHCERRRQRHYTLAQALEEQAQLKAQGHIVQIMQATDNKYIIKVGVNGKGNNNSIHPTRATRAGGHGKGAG